MVSRRYIRFNINNSLVLSGEEGSLPLQFLPIKYETKTWLPFEWINGWNTAAPVMKENDS